MEHLSALSHAGVTKCKPVQFFSASPAAVEDVNVFVFGDSRGWRLL